MDADIALRPVSEDDLPMLETLTGDPAASGEFAWIGWVGRPRWRERWNEDRLLGQDGGALIVTRGQEPLGVMNWRKHLSGPAAHSWEIGIAMLPAARGQGHGSRAQLLLARYLFAHTTVHRVSATTETGNLAEQRALEKAGFTREGVLRGVGWRDGAWRDGVVYSLLRTDPVAAPAPALA
ncbi:MAG TPA: GNAT family protein [Streptosporangiaceae bacterium]|jgi:RimJ/RimL family protein N-acetyltransferase